MKKYQQMDREDFIERSQSTRPLNEKTTIFIENHMVANVV